MTWTSLALCERCGVEGAEPYEIETFMTDDGAEDGQDAAETTEMVAFFLCDECAAILRHRAPVSHSDIVDDSIMIARIKPIRQKVAEVSQMQAEMDRLRNQITSRKTSLRLAVRRLANEITDEQWRRLIETEQKQGETSLVFWLEKYRPRR